MDRHFAWLLALVIVLLVWLGLLCYGAKAKKRGSNSRIAHRESPVPQRHRSATDSNIDWESNDRQRDQQAGRFPEVICNGRSSGEMEMERRQVLRESNDECKSMAGEAEQERHEAVAEAIEEGRTGGSKRRCEPDGEEKVDAGGAGPPARDGEGTDRDSADGSRAHVVINVGCCRE